MGIHGFYRWVTEQYEKGSQEGFKITQRVKPNNIACVFFDLNGIFHDAAGEVYGYKKSRIPQEAQRLMARDRKSVV